MLSANTERVPFDYVHTLTRRLHQFFPDNDFHDDMSLYSFSWLHTHRHNKTDNGLTFPDGAEWFVSFYETKNFCRLSISHFIVPVGFSLQELKFTYSVFFLKRRCNRTYCRNLSRMSKKFGILENFIIFVSITYSLF
jgi:hypothetical protein